MGLRGDDAMSGDVLFTVKNEQGETVMTVPFSEFKLQHAASGNSYTTYASEVFEVPFVRIP